MEFSQLFAGHLQRDRLEPRRLDNSRRTATRSTTLSIDRIRHENDRAAHRQVRHQLGPTNLVRRVLRLVQQSKRRVRVVSAHGHRRQWLHRFARVQRCVAHQGLLVSARLLRVHREQDLQANKTVGHTI